MADTAVYPAQSELKIESVCKVVECSHLLADIQVQLPEFCAALHGHVVDGRVEHGDTVAFRCHHLSLKMGFGSRLRSLGRRGVISGEVEDADLVAHIPCESSVAADLGSGHKRF